MDIILLNPTSMLASVSSLRDFKETVIILATDISSLRDYGDNSKVDFACNFHLNVTL
jgi:hypothetical protein